MDQENDSINTSMFYEVHRIECDYCGEWFYDFLEKCTKCGSKNWDYQDVIYGKNYFG